MKVYCVFRHISYEGGDLYHVFDSEEKAKIKVKELTDKNKNPQFEDYDYEEMEVE